MFCLHLTWPQLWRLTGWKLPQSTPNIKMEMVKNGHKWEVRNYSLRKNTHAHYKAWWYINYIFVHILLQSWITVVLWEFRQQVTRQWRLYSAQLMISGSSPDCWPSWKCGAILKSNVYICSIITSCGTWVFKILVWRLLYPSVSSE